MSENEQRQMSGAFIAVVFIALALGIGSLIWCYGLQNHIGEAEKNLTAAKAENAALKESLASTNARLKAATETLGASVGMTQKQLEQRAQSILAAQKAADEKLIAAQEATSKQVASVSSEVSNVKTDVGGVKTDVATTKADLDSTKSQMQRMMGDEGKMSGLIAANHDELEILKHKGDRNYYEFTLQKGAQPTLLSTIKVKLKKVDQKKGKYTLEISSDDRTIEKKDKTMMEPVQFYSGKSPALFEIVVNNVNKNQVSGYLSTPKS
ncbi:hypothetical protein [Terriglobus tenax]|uniref:hypothetical protein n=1 Tax=Terriglobus tenax TaxID=1111115 RepID=UPI0021E01C68|nr:hypothetical protein [Terriglobus tenax]